MTEHVATHQAEEDARNHQTLICVDGKSAPNVQHRMRPAPLIRCTPMPMHMRELCTDLVASEGAQ